MGFLREYKNADLMGLNRPRIRTQRHQKHKINIVSPSDVETKFFCEAVLLLTLIDDFTD